MTQELTDKVVLVTAAGGGIGTATARAFAREGARLMLSDTNTEAGTELAASLRAEGANAHYQYADCTNESDVTELFVTCLNTFGGLDCAANIVGDVLGDAMGPEFHQQSTAGWDATIAVSLRSTYLCMKCEISEMIERGGGAIVNVASLAGLLHVPDSGAAYAAAKAGVIQLTRFAAVNYADRDIRVNCIAPGVTRTAAYFKGGDVTGNAMIADLVQNQAIARVIEPEEQANAMLWLCSAQASMITGQVLPVDGGWSAR